MPAFSDQSDLAQLATELAESHWSADAQRERGGPITDWDDLVCVVETLGAGGTLCAPVLLGHLESVFPQLADIQVGPAVSLYLTAPERTDRMSGFSPWARSRTLHPLEQTLIAQAAMLACLRSGALAAELLPDGLTVRAVWQHEPEAADPVEQAG